MGCLAEMVTGMPSVASDSSEFEEFGEGGRADIGARRLRRRRRRGCMFVGDEDVCVCVCSSFVGSRAGDGINPQVRLSVLSDVTGVDVGTEGVEMG